MVRPASDVIIVELEPGRKMSGLLHLVSEDRVRIGKVLAVGPGRWASDQRFRHRNKPGKALAVRVPVGVEPGDRVAFFVENLQHKQGRQLMQVLENNQAMIRADDVLVVVDGETTVEFT